MSTDAAPTTTADEFYAVGEGLNAINGDVMWDTFDYGGINTINLSYNAFTNTSIVALDFRESYTGDHEPLIHHLDMSHNLISDASLEFFTLFGELRIWYLITLDLSYNQITNMSNFPTKKGRGDLEILNLENNLIIHIGNPDPIAFLDITIDSTSTPANLEVNLEYNQMTEMPWLGFTYADTDGVTNAKINVKNNKISSVDLTGGCGNECGYWYLKVVDLENNKITEFTYEMIDLNYDTEIFNFNNNKITQLSAFTPSDSEAYYKVKYLYFNNNKIISIDSQAFDHFDKLEILELSSNKITIFPFDHIFDNNKLPFLSSVLLHNNDMTSVSNETTQFPRGVKIVISLNGKTINNLTRI